MSNRHPVTLEMTCIDLPDPRDYPDLYLGLIEDKEFKQAVSLDQAFRAGKATFNCKLGVVLDEETQKAVFYGPAAQGGFADRFIYLGWQRKTAAGWETFQRIKLPLSIFSYAAAAFAAQNQVGLRIQLQVKDKHNRPAAASLKPERLQVLD